MSLLTVSHGCPKGVQKRCPNCPEVPWSHNQKKPGEQYRDTETSTGRGDHAREQYRVVGVGTRVVGGGNGYPGTGAPGYWTRPYWLLVLASLATGLTLLATGLGLTGYWPGLTD